MKIYLLLGAPGSGKSTMAKYVNSNYNFRYINFGSLLRKEIEEETILGKKIKNIVYGGELIDSDVVIFLLKNEFKKLEKVNNLLLDGCPRSIAQAIIFEDFLQKKGLSIQKVFFLKTSKKICWQRISKRVSLLRRKDDEKTSIREKRYTIFLKKISPLVDYFKKKEKLVTLNASLELHSIQKNIDKIFTSLV